MITVKHRGSFNKIERLLKYLPESRILEILNHYGQEGVVALSTATPVDTGLTAQSWDYNVDIKNGKYTLSWTNYNINSGVPVAILLQYGHGTSTGKYIQGYDYINPATRPVFKHISTDFWEEIRTL